MSVASEINRIKSNIADAYTEAEAKGATMPATENSANLADTVASIPSTPTPPVVGTYIKEYPIEVEIGENTISNVVEFMTYLSNIVSQTYPSASLVCFSITGDFDFSNNLVLSTDTREANKVFRYRYGAVASIPSNVLSYDASVPSGTKYVLYVREFIIPSIN